MMEKRKLLRRQIVEATTTHLNRHGPPLPTFGQIEETAGHSRQLIRYYFENPDDLMREVCDYLAEAYRMALVSGAETLKGPSRLRFVFDFYFDLVDELPKPRDDQAYDALFAYAAGSPEIKNNLRGQYLLLGQVLQMELKMLHPALSLEDCAEISYLFVCLMYGHWKMVATLGVSEDHKHISRRAIDRIIASYVGSPRDPTSSIKVWETA